jgi:hypothetical protein
MSFPDGNPEAPLKRARTEEPTASIPTGDSSFKLTIKQAALDLEEKGYAVVPGVFEPEFCDGIKAQLWDWMRRTTQGRVKPNDPSTWNSVNWVPHTHYIVQHYKMGHSKAVWAARKHPNAIKVFAHLYGTDKLTVSYDGACLWPAPEGLPGEGEDESNSDDVASASTSADSAPKKKKKWPRDNIWLHADQSPYATDRMCVQGFANFEEVDGQWDSTLKVIPGSHKKHEDLVSKHGIRPEMGGKQAGKPDKNHWYKFTEEELERIYGKDFREKVVRVSAPKGSIVLWDSRTVHQNCPPIKGRPIARDRAIVYLCYGPADWMSDAEVKNKAQRAIEERMSSHWPWQTKLFGKSPRTYGRVLPDFDEQTGERDDDDPLVRKLCCLDGAYPKTAGSGLLGWINEQQPLITVLKDHKVPNPPPKTTMKDFVTSV